MLNDIMIEIKINGFTIGKICLKVPYQILLYNRKFTCAAIDKYIKGWWLTGLPTTCK